MFRLIIFALLATSISASFIQRPLSNGKNISVYYHCYGNIETATRQAWFLQGGPGGSSDALDSSIYTLSLNDEDGYYCLTDYRGVGRSDELRCSTQIDCDVAINCKNEIENRSDYYTEEASRDVIALVNLHKSINPGIETTIYGVSYGTFWVQKIMQIDNDVADKWIFDGVVLQPWFDAGAWQYGEIDSNNKIINFLISCTQNPVCQKHFSEKDLDDFGKYLTTLTNDEKWLNAVILNSVFVRPSSSPNNFIEVINKVNFLLNGGNIFDKRENYCSHNNIIYQIVKANELYAENGYNDNYLNFKILAQQLYFSTLTIDINNTYPWIDEFVVDYRPIITSGKVLVLGGEWDVQTIEENSHRLHQYFINHGVNSSVYIGKNFGHGIIGFDDDTGSPCGLKIIFNFILGNEIDSKCLEKSSFKTFENADYVVYPEQGENNEEIYIVNTSAIVFAVLFAVSFIIIIILGVLLYRRKKIVSANFDYAQTI